MAVPKKKVSKSKRKMRQSHLKAKMLKTVTFSKINNSGNFFKNVLRLVSAI